MQDKIKIGTSVQCQIRNSAGSLEPRVGELTALNSRYATVKLGDGIIVKVGKTKIKRSWIEASIDADADAEKGDPEIRTRDTNRVECRSSSGRKSVDNGDATAIELRGETLEVTYLLAAKTLEVSLISLRSRYSHLNNGQQRMCLGNLIRHATKNAMPNLQLKPGRTCL